MINSINNSSTDTECIAYYWIQNILNNMDGTECKYNCNYYPNKDLQDNDLSINCLIDNMNYCKKCIVKRWDHSMQNKQKRINCKLNQFN